MPSSSAASSQGESSSSSTLGNLLRSSPPQPVRSGRSLFVRPIPRTRSQPETTRNDSLLVRHSDHDSGSESELDSDEPAADLSTELTRDGSSLEVADPGFEFDSDAPPVRPLFARRCSGWEKTNLDAEFGMESDSDDNKERISSDGNDNDEADNCTDKGSDSESITNLGIHVFRRTNLKKVVTCLTPQGEDSEDSDAGCHDTDINEITASESESEQGSPAPKEEIQEECEQEPDLRSENSSSAPAETASISRQTETIMPEPSIEIREEDFESEATTSTSSPPVRFTEEEMAELGDILAGAMAKLVSCGSSLLRCLLDTIAELGNHEGEHYNIGHLGINPISSTPETADDSNMQGIGAEEAGGALVPVPDFKISVSDATYIVLRNGASKCKKLFWWNYLDSYTREFLEYIVHCENVTSAFAKNDSTDDTDDLETGKDLMDEEWQRIAQARFSKSIQKRQKDAPVDDQLERMYEIHLGCYLAVSHLDRDLRPLMNEALSSYKQVVKAMDDPSLEMNLPTAPFLPTLHTVVDSSKEFEVANMAFNQIQQRITDYQAQISRTTFASQEESSQPQAEEQTVGEILGPKVRKILVKK
ncbi:hypothetical protein PWT90_02853 [Aphanocladium album]|nr:hypothetical protein PWT90_02853 [Aphanocladium album]